MKREVDERAREMPTRGTEEKEIGFREIVVDLIGQVDLRVSEGGETSLIRLAHLAWNIVEEKRPAIASQTGQLNQASRCTSFVEREWTILDRVFSSVRSDPSPTNRRCPDRATGHRRTSRHAAWPDESAGSIRRLPHWRTGHASEIDVSHRLWARRRRCSRQTVGSCTERRTHFIDRIERDLLFEERAALIERPWSTVVT